MACSRGDWGVLQGTTIIAWAATRKLARQEALYQKPMIGQARAQIARFDYGAASAINAGFVSPFGLNDVGEIEFTSELSWEALRAQAEPF